MATLAVIRDQAIGNARALADDAQVLFHAGQRWAGARYLAALAIEEVGKAWLCHREICGLPGIEGVDLRHSHGLNTMAAGQFLALLAQEDRLRARITGYRHGEDVDVTEEQAADAVGLASHAARAARRMREWRPAGHTTRIDPLLNDIQLPADEIPVQVQRSAS